MVNSRIGGNKHMTTGRQANAMFVAGEMAGLSSKLDTDALEEYLKAPADDFRYAELCKAAIAFTEAVWGTMRPIKLSEAKPA
jgi:hypothetical protein